MLIYCKMQKIVSLFFSLLLDLSWMTIWVSIISQNTVIQVVDVLIRCSSIDNIFYIIGNYSTQ